MILLNLFNDIALSLMLPGRKVMRGLIKAFGQASQRPYCCVIASEARQSRFLARLISPNFS
jgi:hypothetical protein